MGVSADSQPKSGRERRRSLLVPVLYAAVGLVLLTSRLFSVLHAESSAVVAFCAFFIAGLSAIAGLRRAESPALILKRHLIWLTLPLLALTLSMLWVPNCAYGTGLLLYLAFAPPSVVLGVAIAYLLEATSLPMRRLLFVVLGLVIAIGGVIYDLALHPQFYVLNHVFGGVLGPVYEDALYVRPGLAAFRIMTLLWALAAFVVGRRIRAAPHASSAERRRFAVILAVVALALGSLYFFSPRLGINTPVWHLQRELGGHLSTANFDLYYDPEVVSADEVESIGRQHEYRHASLRRRLGVAPQERIRSYLYPTLRQKLRLTGAGLTDVAPVWLRQPQMHLYMGAYEETLGHELVHVFSREFGLPLINASIYVGLVEGLAVALEPPDGRPSPREQVAVAVRRAGTHDVGVESDIAQALVGMLTPRAFWSGRGAVSYTTTGDFARFLMDRFGVEKMRDVYARGNFESVYGMSLAELASLWVADLAAVPAVSRATDDLIMRRFTAPSLFEKDCPHYLPAHAAHYRAALDLLARGDSVSARAAVERSLEAEPAFAQALAMWSRLALGAGKAAEVRERLSQVSDLTSAALSIHRGDAVALLGDTTAARRQYESAYGLLPQYDRVARMLVLVRLSSSDPGQTVRILYGQAPAEHEARVGRGTGVAAAWALHLASTDDYAGAVRFMVEASEEGGPFSSEADRRFFERMARVWSGVWLAHLGRFEAAEESLERAAVQALVQSDISHVAEIRDRIEWVRWKAGAPVDAAAAPMSGRRVHPIPLDLTGSYGRNWQHVGQNDVGGIDGPGARFWLWGSTRDPGFDRRRTCECRRSLHGSGPVTG